MSESNNEIPHSDIISSIKRISGHIDYEFSEKKWVLIISDMLENLSMTSFYKNGEVRILDPEGEF